MGLSLRSADCMLGSQYSSQAMVLVSELGQLPFQNQLPGDELCWAGWCLELPVPVRGVSDGELGSLFFYSGA